MSFVGMGAAGAVMDAGAILEPQGSYTGDRWDVDAAGGGEYPGQPTVFEELLTEGIEGTLSLGARAGAPDPANADTGELHTDVPGANAHGLPSNFGAGRNHWRQLDMARLVILVDTLDDFVGGSEYPLARLSSVQHVTSGNVPGDVEIQIHNVSAEDANNIRINLLWFSA